MHRFLLNAKAKSSLHAPTFIYNALKLWWWSTVSLNMMH